jgi:hypothetical protein
MKGKKVMVGPSEVQGRLVEGDLVEQDKAREAREKSESPAQQVLPNVGKAAMPKVVRGGRMLARFVRAHFDRDGKDRAVAVLEVSFPLTPEHKGMLPTAVEKQWNNIKAGGVTSITVRDIPAQTIGISLLPDDKEDLVLVGALIQKATLALKIEKGKGKTVEVIRYSFRISAERSKEIIKFATTYDGSEIWITSKRTQASLLD